MNMKTKLMTMAALATLLLSSLGAHAEDRRYFDKRYSHNQYYLDRGVRVAGVPRGAYQIRHRGQTYWYHGGEWFRPRGRVSIVVGAPIGAFVPVLPPFYSTVWWRGVPYYYADNTYYLWDGGAREYKVVDAPSGIDSGGTTVAPSSDDVFIYPKNGQSQDQQDRDRYECHRFGVVQTGYDPTLAGGGVDASVAASKRSDYLRAQAACLEGRGYTVK
jgi:hypothetical protein